MNRKILRMWNSDSVHEPPQSLERFQTNSFDNFLFTFHENSSNINIRSCHYASFLDIKRQQEFCSHFIPLDVMNHVFNAKCDTFEIHPLKYCNVWISLVSMRIFRPNWILDWMVHIGKRSPAAYFVRIIRFWVKSMESFTLKSVGHILKEVAYKHIIIRSENWIVNGNDINYKNHTTQYESEHIQNQWHYTRR